MRVYYGWAIVAVTVLIYMVAVGGTIQAYGLFVLPVSQAFHLTRAEMNTGAIALNVGMAIAGPILGRVVDRHSIRRVMGVSALVLGSSLVALGLSDNLMLSAAIIAIGLAGAVVGCGTMAAPVLVARWFSHQRGRAMAISTLGISFGPVVAIPLISLLLQSFGWRHCLMVMGVIWAAVLLLLTTVIRDGPGVNDEEPGAALAGSDARRRSPAPEQSLSLGRLLKQPQFWTIGLAAALVFAILATTLVSLIPHAQAQGLSVTQAASTMSAYGIAALTGSLLFAWRGDRLGRLRVFASLAVSMGLATGGYALAHSYFAILACTAIVGVSSGGFTPAYLALLADRFGTESFGVASGAASFVTTFVSAVGIRYGGEIYDHTGSYHLMFLSFLVMGAFAAGLAIGTGFVSPVRRQGRGDQKLAE